MKYIKKYEKYNNLYNNVALYLETIAPLKKYFIECYYDDVTSDDVFFTYEYHEFPDEYIDDILDFIDENFYILHKQSDCHNCFSFTLTDEQMKEFNNNWLIYSDTEKYNI